MTFKTLLMTSLVAISLAACSSTNKTTEDGSINTSSVAADSESIAKTFTIPQELISYEVPKFPYQKYLDSIDWFPVIGDDGGGFDAISDKIRYPKMPNDIKSSKFIDSLLVIYNMALVYNTIAYDVSTDERRIEESTFTNAAAHSLDNINLSGIKDLSMKDLLSKMGKTAAQHLRKHQIQTDYVNPYVEPIYKCFNAYMNEILGDRESAPQYDPSSDLDYYADLHKQVLNDTSALFRNNLTAMTLKESDFRKKCVLAYELACSYYRDNGDLDYAELVTIIDELLKSGEFSPLLYKLWLIWRSTLQTRVFSGFSNDSAMYNLFYNDMRNTVAVTLLRRLSSHPDDPIALSQFVKLALAYNIVRNCYKTFNNAVADQAEAMPDLYKK